MIQLVAVFVHEAVTHTSLVGVVMRNYFIGIRAAERINSEGLVFDGAQERRLALTRAKTDDVLRAIAYRIVGSMQLPKAR
jgi:hypothetical protein